MSISVRVVVVDDQTVMREGLVLILGLIPDVIVAGDAANGEDALRVVAREKPDIVLMDLRMPRMDGVEATRQIRSRYPNTQVLVLTTYSDDESIQGAIQAGARGYITKNARAGEIAHAIHTVLSGNIHVDPTVQQRIIDMATRQRPARSNGLTPRELDVLRLIAAGNSNSEIAQRLHITEGTVKTHVNHILAKTGLRDRAQAVAFAFQRGHAHLPEPEKRDS